MHALSDPRVFFNRGPAIPIHTHRRHSDEIDTHRHDTYRPDLASLPYRDDAAIVLISVLRRGRGGAGAVRGAVVAVPAALVFLAELHIPLACPENQQRHCLCYSEPPPVRRRHRRSADATAGPPTPPPVRRRHRRSADATAAARHFVDVDVGEIAFDGSLGMLGGFARFDGALFRLSRYGLSSLCWL